MERKLITIQEKELLNHVYAIDEPSIGGANHKYEIKKADSDTVLATIQFQEGPRKEEDSISGILDGDLLEIVRDRMRNFQQGEFSNEYNRVALEHVERALDALNRRVEDRIRRNVLGTNTK